MGKGLRTMTQGELNLLWENPPVDMAQRYANYMKTMLICFVFAPIFPMGLVIGFFSMFLQYWTDKILFLRRHARPPQLGQGLSDNIIYWMPILIISYAVTFTQASNLITFYMKSESDSNSFLHNFPIAVFGLSVFYFIFPCKCACINSKSLKIPIEQDNYKVQVLNFVADYQRCNPVTSKQGWADWLKLIEGNLLYRKKRT